MIENQSFSHSVESGLPVLQIPLDYGRRQQTFSYESTHITLKASLSRELKQKFGEQMVYPAFLSAYAALLFRLSAEEELAIGVLAPDQAASYLSLELQGKTTFTELFEQITKQLQIPYTQQTGGYPETMFMLNSVQLPQAPQVMNWNVRYDQNEMILDLFYDRSLLQESTILRYAEYFQTLLLALLRDGHKAIGAVDILSTSDRLLYREMNDTAVLEPAYPTIHSWFEAVAAAYPNSPAITSLSASYTYRELNERANQVARVLISNGLKQGEFVSIFMDRSLDTIISLLGVLKAGGAYVPIDPEHPQERNSYIVEDTASPFVLTTEASFDQAKALFSGISTVRHILSVDGRLAGFAASNPNLDIKPDDLAYVIYTSGSTGKPKGALIAHRGVTNLGSVVQRDCDIQPGDVLTQFATYSFDASVWDTIGALFYGAELYLLSAEERVSIEEFASAIERTGTTIITILPTIFFNQLASYLSDEGFHKLAKVRIITVAGEALYGEQVRAFQRKFGNQIDIVNVYGPTECTVATTTHRISEQVPGHVVNIPIGRPIHNYKVYIVNEEHQLCPVGVPGEVYIATPALAKGYLNQPERTEQSFIDNPFAIGEKIYKSGDIAKMLDTGLLEYVGRSDSQLKIRGHRIEIGEIEDHLARLEQIQDVAVIAKKEADGQNMLVGYFTSKDGSTLSVTDIKATLSEKLPSYFVPKWICQLDEMPIAPTGKINRKAMVSMPHAERHTDQPDRVMPETETESILFHAWKEILQHEEFGVEDSFFSIGGDSLRVIHVLVLLKPHYPQLKIADFFAEKTIRALARRVALLSEQREPAKQTSTATGIITQLSEHPVELSPQLGYPNILQPEHVLLTGATGYLGSHVLQQLIVKSSARIYALVRRPSDGTTAMARLSKVMLGYFGKQLADQLEGRVVIVEGNLEEKNLGLAAEQQTLLESRIDRIIHCAADVRHFGEAAQFAKTNVEGTVALLDLIRNKKGASFHHISTMGIPEDLALSGQWESTLQYDRFPEELHVDNVYSDSKLEAEKVLMNAAAEGVPVSIYRAGNLTCDSRTGRFQTNIDSNAIYRMIKAMLLLGKAPAADWLMDFTPINYASEAIVHLALRQDTAGRVFHICNPEPIRYDALVEAVKHAGYNVETMPFEDYNHWLFDTTIAKEPEALQLAIAQLEGDGAKDSAYAYASPVTTAYVEPAGIFCAKTDERFIHTMLDYAVQIGYFPAAIRPNYGTTTVAD
ncbi:amino acid adenylation domain-containing protein/thioester reductase-like protein [Paenibacillus sp. 4624]|uniref:Amino acid adenylation domain-containing protein n=1 Tax=Paenibacillus amylolyticus TaxID=1451 RepID=A0A5M9WSS8_PAEAM|nr:amino acid adenylation domain-containing protein [Paenibacillus amylolyticus]KAA8784543.1 amino acid adenylation domain-containing protein [Paenibacillus amylolyticus]